MHKNPEVFQLGRNDIHLAIKAHMKALGHIKEGDTTSVQFVVNENCLLTNAEVTVSKKGESCE